MKVKEESEKVGLKLNIHKTKILASSPITSWEIDGETVETVSDFIFLGPKITADGDCSHEIKTFTPWKESYDQHRQQPTRLCHPWDSPDKNTGVGCHFLLHYQPRQHIKKQRHYFADKLSSVQLLSCVRLCDPMDCSITGFPVHQQLQELTQTQCPSSQ